MQTFLGLQRSIDTFTPCYFKRFLKNTTFAGWHTFMTVFEQKIKQQSAIYFDFCRCTHTELILLYHLRFRSDHIKLLKYNAKESSYLPSTRTNKSTCKRGSSLGVCVWAVNCVSVFSFLFFMCHAERRACSVWGQWTNYWQPIREWLRGNRRKHQGKIRRLFGNTHIHVSFPSK